MDLHDDFWHDVILHNVYFWPDQCKSIFSWGWGQKLTTSSNFCILLVLDKSSQTFDIVSKNALFNSRYGFDYESQSGDDKTKLTNWKVISDSAELVMFTYHFGAVGVANQNSFHKCKMIKSWALYIPAQVFTGFQNFIHSVINNHSYLSHKFLKIELYGEQQQVSQKIHRRASSCFKNSHINLKYCNSPAHIK